MHRQPRKECRACLSLATAVGWIQMPPQNSSKQTGENVSQDMMKCRIMLSPKLPIPATLQFLFLVGFLSKGPRVHLRSFTRMNVEMSISNRSLAPNLWLQAMGICRSMVFKAQTVDKEVSLEAPWRGPGPNKSWTVISIIIASSQPHGRHTPT